MFPFPWSGNAGDSISLSLDPQNIFIGQTSNLGCIKAGVSYFTKVLLEKTPDDELVALQHKMICFFKFQAPVMHQLSTVIN